MNILHVYYKITVISCLNKGFCGIILSWRLACEGIRSAEEKSIILVQIFDHYDLHLITNFVILTTSWTLTDSR